MCSRVLDDPGLLPGAAVPGGAAQFLRRPAPCRRRAPHTPLRLAAGGAGRTARRYGPGVARHPGGGGAAAGAEPLRPRLVVAALAGARGRGQHRRMGPGECHGGARRPLLQSFQQSRAVAHNVDALLLEPTVDVLKRSTARVSM